MSNIIKILENDSLLDLHEVYRRLVLVYEYAQNLKIEEGWRALIERAQSLELSILEIVQSCFEEGKSGESSIDNNFDSFVKAYRFLETGVCNFQFSDRALTLANKVASKLIAEELEESFHFQ